MKNQIEFKVWGRFALFTDPLTRLGGEKCSYHIPTYEALKGVAKSIYWKPTFIWVIDRARVVRSMRTKSKNMKLIKYGGRGNDLAIYTYLVDVEYQIQAHFEWNLHYPELAHDRIDGKHFAVAKRMVKKGGRRDIFLGTRECQGYVEPSTLGAGKGAYDDGGELEFGLTFHGFEYPDENGKEKLYTRFWRPKMVDGVIDFLRPEDCQIRQFVRNQTIDRPISNGLNEEVLIDELDSEVV